LHRDCAVEVADKMDTANGNSNGIGPANFPAMPPAGGYQPCDWHRFLGCVLAGVEPKDVCQHEGCEKKIHHACATNAEMKQYEHDDPEGAEKLKNVTMIEEGGPSCPYDSHGGKYCLNHHPSADIFLSRIRNAAAARPKPAAGVDRPVAASKVPDQPANKKRKKGKEKLTEEQKKAKRQRQKLWAESMTIDDITLNVDNKDVVSLGGRPWADLDKTTREDFMKHNSIPIPQALRKKGKLGQVIANFMKGSLFRDKVVAPTNKNYENQATGPEFISRPGTLFRLVNTITSERGKRYFIQLRASHDREDQDT